MKILNEIQIVFNHVDQRIEELKQTLQELGKSQKRLDEVEQALMTLLMQVGLAALSDFVESAGYGNVGEKIERDGARPLKCLEEKTRNYRSVFGLLEIKRFVYGLQKKQKTVAPLDQRLGLPQAETSYLLENWMSSLACYLPYASCHKWLKQTFGLGTGSTTIERRVERIAAYSEAFREQDNEDFGKETQQPDGALLVAQADGKGIPIRTPWEQTLQQELGKKPHLRHRKNNYPKSERRRRRGDQAKSQEATVGACYSIARHVRTTDEVLEQGDSVDRPKPENKRLFGEFNRIVHQPGKQVSRGAERVFIQLAAQVAQRSDVEEVVCIMDGAVSLWNLKERYLPDAIGIIDIYHVTERLWDVAHCLEKDGSQAAEDRVTHWLRMLLDGKVDAVRGLFTRLLNQKSWSQCKQQKIEDAISYFKNNRDAMRYDIYLASGYPIGSGVIEGACKHVIGGRFCGSGMRWEHETAQSLLHLRTIELSQRWQQFVKYRIQAEQNRIYPALAA